MGVKWRNHADLDTMQARIGSFNAKKRREVDRILDDAADRAVDRMREIISTVPSSLVKDKIGRIDTGAMYAAVSRSKVQKNANLRSVEFGWVNESDREDYFLKQELGTGDKKSGGIENIVPMLALQHAFQVAVQEVIREINA